VFRTSITDELVARFVSRHEAELRLAHNYTRNFRVLRLRFLIRWSGQHVIRSAHELAAWRRRIPLLNRKIVADYSIDSLSTLIYYLFGIKLP
jgi:hypothetical protein